MTRNRITVAVLVLAGALWATTWGPAEIVCPICGEKNIFQVWASYGGYIYRWPSKFQMIFWPFTTGNVLYHCKKCNYTAFLTDFSDPPKDKVGAIKSALKDVKLQHPADEYTNIPMSERLRIAETVYSVLPRDDEFWCHFYRVKGYHLQYEKKAQEADEARRKALELASKMMAAPENEGRKKELLVIIAGMHHYLRDDKAALSDLQAAALLTFKQPKLEEDKNKGYDQYLTDLIAEYENAIKTGKSTDE